MASNPQPALVQQMLFDKIRRAMRQGETSWTDWWKDTIEKNNLLNYPSIHTGLTLLHVAGRWGRLSEVEYLLAQGARVDVQDLLGHTALWLAAWQGHASIVEKLLEAGATLEKHSLLVGDSPLQIARKRGHEETVELLSRKRDRNLVLANRVCSLDSSGLQQKIDELTRTKRPKVDLQEQYHAQQMQHNAIHPSHTQHMSDPQPLAYHMHPALSPPLLGSLSTNSTDRLLSVAGMEELLNSEDIFNPCPGVKSNTLFL